MDLYSTTDYDQFYWPEIHIFDEIRKTFEDGGNIDPFALYIILDWKSSRAKKYHVDRMKKLTGSSYHAAVEKLGKELFVARCPEERLRIMLVDWKFRLPTATAILSVLYPTDFTIYDVRVCAALEDFKPLNDIRWSHQLWERYEEFKTAVRKATPGLETFRDKDRWLWGKSKYKDLRKQIASEEK